MPPWILMCPPDHYGIEYEINPWMSRSRASDRATAVAQWNGLKTLIERAGARVSDIGAAVQQFVEAQGFSVVREFVGHGIGTALHEEPQIPNYGTPGRGPRLAAGMVLAIEPMVTLGSHRVHTLSDEWTVVTDDGSRASHWEHTVAITETGPWVLTALDDVRL